MIYINLRCYERKKKQKRDLKPPTSKEERQFTTHIWMYVSRLIEYLYVQGWCVCRRFRVLWIGLGFLLKAMVFTFTLEKNHLKCQFFNEGNQCALSPSDSSVWKHASTYALWYMYNHLTKKFKYFVCLFDWYETYIGKAIQIGGEWTWSKSYRYICIRSIDFFFTWQFEANGNTN